MKSLLRILRIRKNNRLKGFTLVETLVTLTIFSFIAAAIAVSFVTGTKLWAKAKDADLAGSMNLLILEAISKELRQCVNIPAIGFEGAAAEISFASLIGNSILKITYKFDPQAKALIRRETDLKAVLDDKLKDGYTEKRIASPDDFSLSYFCFDKEENDYVWLDAWEKGKGIFTAIKLHAKFKGRDFTKTVFIPIS